MPERALKTPRIFARVEEVIAGANAWVTKLPKKLNKAGIEVPTISNEGLADACRDFIEQIEKGLAGLPTTVVPGLTWANTALPMPMTAPSPMRRPG